MRGRPKNVAELLEAYIDDRDGKVRHLESLSDHTKSVNEYFGHYSLREICEPKFLEGLCRKYVRRQEKHHTNNTIRKRLAVLRAALGWAAKDKGWISVPVMYFPPVTRPDRIITEKERKRLLTVADEQAEYPHTRLFTYLVLHTRQNKRPILNLTWDRVRDDHILFDGEYEKPRVRVPIDAKFHAILEEERLKRDRRCNHVIQFRGHRVSSVIHSFNRLLKAADLDGVTLHDLRRTARDDETSANAPDVAQTDTAPDDVFISYRTSDGVDWARTLADALQRLGQPSWAAFKDVMSGERPYPGQLAQRISASAGLVLIVTPGVAESRGVMKEIVCAQRFSKAIIPIIVDGANMGEDLEFLLGEIDHRPWRGPEETAQLVLAKLGVA